MREKDRLLRQEAAAEAVLFTMGRAVELRELSAALETGEEEARAAVERLREKYREEGRGLSIIELSGSFQMCTKAEYYENLIREMCIRDSSRGERGSSREDPSGTAGRLREVIRGS